MAAYSLPRIIVSKLLETVGMAAHRRRSGFILAPAAVPSLNAGFAHGPIIPHCSFSPWLADEDFLRVHRSVRGNTLVDIYRCYDLWQLVEQACKVEGDILEVGVWRGGTGAVMAARLARLGVSKRVYLCDTFTGVVKAGERDTRYRGSEHADTNLGMVTDLLESVGVTQWVTICQGIYPEDTGPQVGDGALCMVHIDVDVYRSASDILDQVWPRIPVGGLVVFDDYGFHGCEGITSLVEEQRRHADKLVIHNLNGHAVFVKTA